MTAADYFDWWHFSGTGLGTSSTDDRCTQLRRELSTAGANVVFVQYLLQDCPEVIDLARWRGTMFGHRGAQFRLTVDALEAIGAARAVKALRDDPGAQRVVPSSQEMLRLLKTDPGALNNRMEALRGGMLAAATDKGILPDSARGIVPPQTQTEAAETREEVIGLLEAYVEREQKSLAGDVAKHRDPRQAADFDPQRFIAEQQLHDKRLLGFRHQRQVLPELRQQLAEMKQRIADTPTVSESIRRQGQKLLKQYREFARRDAEDLTAHLQVWLRDVERLRDERRDVFCPRPTDDDALNARLMAIGDYELDVDSAYPTVTWQRPPGLECDWTRFDLAFMLDLREGRRKLRGKNADRKVAAYTSLIEAWERFRLRFRELEPQLRRCVLEIFRAGEEDMDPDSRAEYEDGSAGISDDAILSHVESGNILFTYVVDRVTGPELRFEVAWEVEHFLEIELDAEGQIVRW